MFGCDYYLARCAGHDLLAMQEPTIDVTNTRINIDCLFTKVFF